MKPFRSVMKPPGLTQSLKRLKPSRSVKPVWPVQPVKPGKVPEPLMKPLKPKKKPPGLMQPVRHLKPEVPETRRTSAIREADEAAEVQEAARALDEAIKAQDEATEVCETSTSLAIHEGEKGAEACEAAEAREATKDIETCEITKTHKATNACDETIKVRVSCEVTEVRETHMACMIREAGEAAAAREIHEATKAQEAAVACEIPEATMACEAAEASDTFKASESQDSHEATEAIKTSEFHETSEAGEISQVAEASVSCETAETSEARKVSEASKEQKGGKGKAKKKGKGRGKGKAKADVGHFPTEDDDNVASQDPLYPTAGWDDEWVPESRLLKYSEISLQKQRELFEASQEQSAKGKMVGIASGKNTSEGPQQNTVENNVEVPSVSVKTSRKEQNIVSVTGSGSAGNIAGCNTGSRDGSKSEISQQPHWGGALVNSDGEPCSGFMRRSDFEINIPAELKPWLVNDWNLITGQKKLFCLPAKKNVESILEDYELYEKSYANSEDKICGVPEVVAGIREYFNLMLGSHLLYTFEKPQYATILANDPGVPMSQIYGAPHLLRLFVKIGDMLSCAFFDSHSTTLLSEYLHDFVKYLAKNSAALFSPNDYELASPEYLQKAAEEPENICHS
ncbi:uncharacterized protein LOC110203762 [Phascolarctos cinereus]|uniref:Uncharacterized protein LOC110203762 n=1 Tax=Phascolarctos cinereus TaxID=38626 RepID=A0A6P5JNM9_PHACI|nr:uncharacterized protein LOC110203762 [Phascolarctos cinereus]